MKKPKAKKLKKECIKLAKEIIRSKGRCDKCGKTDRQFHGSHILSTGAYPALAAELDNILCLCASCHTLAPDSWHKEIVKNYEWLNEKFPGRLERLKLLAQVQQKVDWDKKWKELNDHQNKN